MQTKNIGLDENTVYYLHNTHSNQSYVEYPKDQIAYIKSPRTKKQIKARETSKKARKARRRNR
jgi:hypothetical protein